MMKRFSKQLVCWLLTAVMVAGLLPVSAIRAEEEPLAAVPLGDEVAFSPAEDDISSPVGGDADVPASLLEGEAALTPPTVPAGADVKEDWQTDLRPADGTTQGQPFPGEGLAGGDFFRIPTIVTVKGHTNDALNGTLVAATDIRWKSHLDSSNIDTAVSWSSDNGATWHYSFPNFFGDIALTATANKSALFIDPVLTADNSGNLYLMVNAFPAGVSTHGTSYQRPEETTGFAEIGGVSRMTVYTSPENSVQDDDNYSYYIGDFTGGYAPILNAGDGTESGFYTDDHFYLYYTEGTKDPTNDKIYCAQMGGSNATTDTWVQQNLFYYNATLHVRNAQFLYMVKSSDGGRTWGTPTILNDQVRTGEHTFYGPGPGAGTCLDDGTIIIPTYTINERSSFIYSNDGGESWNRGPTLGWESTENMIVRIDSDTIRQFYRNRNHDLYYADYTREGGVWTPNAAVFTGQQKQGNNQISALRYTGQVNGKDIILVSTASNTDSSASGYARKGGKVIVFCLNEDNTMTYLATYRINEPTDWYGYSSLTQLADGSVGIIYENSQTDGNDPNSPGYCGLTYFSLSLDTLTGLVRRGLLEALIREAETLSEDNYSAASWAAFTPALTAAQAVSDNEAASAAEIETAKSDLQAAIDALELVPVVISGTVTDESGAAVMGATVTLEDASYRSVGLTATTDAAGSFSFRSTKEHILAVAQYQLKVQAPGYLVNTFSAGTITRENPTSRTACTLVAEEPGAYVNNFDSGDISMMGTLTTETSGIPTYETVTYNGSGAVKITFHGGNDQATSRNLNNAVDKTEAAKIANGTVSFDITGLTNTVRLGVTLRGTATNNRIFVGQQNDPAKWFWERWTDGANDWRNPETKPIGIYPGETRRVRVELNGTRVKVAIDGIEIYDATMNGAPTGAGYVGINMTQNSGTSYILDNLRIVSADAPTEGSYTVEGTVTTADGAPVAGASVDVYSGDTLVTGTSTNAGGVYKTQALTPDTYIIKVSAPGYPEKTGEITVSDENLTAQNFVLAADKTALQAAYDAVKDMTNDNYTAATWNAFLDARTTAEILLEDAAATQDALDAATEALNAAKEGLAKKPSTPTDPTEPTKPTKPTTTTRPTTTTTETKEDGTTVTTVTNNRTGTVTETTEKPDGTVETVETKKDGTVTATVEEPDGTKAVTKTKPDGTVTATVEQPDGTKSEAVTTPEGDKTIVVTDPEGEELAKVELPAEIPAPETEFEDIDQTPWAAEAIHNVAGLKLVQGTDGNKYDPFTPMTRGQIATVLHRLSNGKTDYELAFKDVEATQFYAEGVAWAAKANVVKGISEDIFAPDQIITREQLAVMLCRYAKLVGMDTKADTATLDAFVDGDTTGDWAVDSVAWCVENGILQGKGDNDLDPNAQVSRVEVAVMLDRFIALI